MGQMRCLVLGLVLGGCYTHPDGPDLDELVDPVDCTGITFNDASDAEFPIEGLDGDPTMTADEQELFYVVNHATAAGSYDWDVHRSVRMGNQYVDMGAQSFNTPGVNDVDGAITADGRLFVFVSAQPGNLNHLYYSTRRERLSDDWSPVQILGGLENEHINTFAMAPDASWIYFGDDTDSLRRASRLPGDEIRFGREPTDHGYVKGYPTMSADELELYITNNGIFRQTRTSTSQTFPLPSGASLFNGETDPYLLANNKVLITVGGGIRVHHRSCPEAPGTRL